MPLLNLKPSPNGKRRCRNRASRSYPSNIETSSCGTSSRRRFGNASDPSAATRSEEHTSELQSHSDLHSFPTRRSSDLPESSQSIIPVEHRNFFLRNKQPPEVRKCIRPIGGH